MNQLEISKKIGSEITVRISLTFQEAPDVHTLLAMTPVRERGKLVRLALERYILSTNHPAGDVDAQIEAVSKWLRSRSQSLPSDRDNSELIGDSVVNQITSKTIYPSQDLLPTAAMPITPNLSAVPVAELAPKSIQRWLDG